jgi:hypothetical protein
LARSGTFSALCVHSSAAWSNGAFTLLNKRRQSEVGQRSLPNDFGSEILAVAMKIALESADEGRVLTPMGHSHGRDNVKKRARRRKKIERLAVAKKNKKKATK